MDKNDITPEKIAIDLNNPTPEEIAKAEALGIPFECIVVLPSPIGAQAVGLIQAARNNGLIRDINQCKDLAGNAVELAKIIGPAGADVITGIHARCACEFVFRDQVKEEERPPPVCKTGREV